MNYTENYQLPQWVESDRVLMEDFNDANSKIDTALKTLATTSHGWDLLLYNNIPTPMASRTLNMPRDLLIEQYLVVIRVSVKGVSARLTINGAGRRRPVNSDAWISDGILTISEDVPGWVILLVGRKTDGNMRGISLGEQLCYVSCDTMPYNWSTLTLTCITSGQQLPSGTVTEIWGSR